VALRSDAPLVVDVTAFVQTLRDARQSPAEANVTLLQRAADLYRGDFLEGFLVRDAPEFEEWALAQRTRYRELALQALHTLTTAHLDSADYTAAIDAAGRLLALDGWREEGYRQLMLALARTGQYTAALSQYQQCRSVMRAAFDAEPAEETTALYAPHPRRVAWTAPQSAGPRSPGFVGRTAEMTLVRQKLANPACRLLTIVGPGGAGKSRLALEAAAALAPAFLNGVWFASLAAANAGEPEALATTLAAALQIPTGAGELKRQVIGYLRQRELLLVLDNLEHLLNDIGWLSELLAAAPDVKILATSRERLNLQAEQIVHLGGLPTPAADHAEPEKFAAVALFARRGAACGAGLCPDAADGAGRDPDLPDRGRFAAGHRAGRGVGEPLFMPGDRGGDGRQPGFSGEHPPRRIPTPAQPARRLRPLLAAAGRVRAAGVHPACRLLRQFHARGSGPPVAAVPAATLARAGGQVAGAQGWSGTLRPA
jgi:tetratricopeptide (TPR) repeat protein